MAIDKDQIIEQLRTVNDPELHRDVVTLGMIKNVTCNNGQVDITLELTTPACPLKHVFREEIDKALACFGDEVKKVNIEFTANVRRVPGQMQAAEKNPLPGVKHIVAVGAGKGGVGKSTVAVNLAVGLARSGAATGILDADIYGPSLPTMLGLGDAKLQAADENTLMPLEAHGLKVMTLGAMVEDGKPLIWRGPMAHNAFQQLATQTQWGELDYLIVDLPPGTGDVPLTMAQLLPLTGAVVVCTPQKVAVDDASRAVAMFEQLNIPVLGIIENMSYFIGDDGKRYDIFGRGGAEALAEAADRPFLGSIPITMALRENSDSGDPAANFAEGTELAAQLETLVRNLAGQISMRAMVGQTEAAANA